MSGINSLGGTPSVAPSRLEQMPQARATEYKVGQGGPPPAAGGGLGEHDPVLPPPSGGMDATGMMTALLALKLKMGDAQERSTEKGIQADGRFRKQTDLDVSKKIEAAAQQQADAAKKSAIMKVFGWIAVALTAIVATVMAVISGGALAIAAAALTIAVAVTMTTLDQTGVLAKMQDAIKDSLVKDGMSEDDAKKWAQGLSMGITIAASLVTLVAGGGGVASVAEETAETVVSTAVKVATMVQKGALAASAAVDVTQAGLGVAAGVESYEAAEDTADAADLRKILAKLKQSMEDQTDTLQQLVAQMQDMTARVMAVVKGQAETNMTMLNNMTATA